MPTKISKIALALAAATAFTASGPVIAAGSHSNSDRAGQSEEAGHGHGGPTTIGEAGRPSEVDRTIEMVMGDNYFEPEKLTIRPGETIRFLIKNEGDFLHEFNLGTAAMHAEHQEEMMGMMESGMLTATGMNQDMMNMDHSSMGMSGHVHDDPNSILVEPGKAQEMVWRFAAAADLEFACNLPGHYDSGMVGDVEFVAPAKTGS